MEERGSVSLSAGKEKKKILLHTVKWEVGGWSYSEFYVIDMENGQVSELRHVLLSDAGTNSLVALGSSIYVVGYPRWEGLRRTKKPPNSHCTKHGLYHRGMSYIPDLTKLKLKPHPQEEDDADDDDCDWKACPVPEKEVDLILRSHPSVAALGGKIYVLEGGGSPGSGVVYDTESKQWERLVPPPEIGTFDALYTTSAVADPDNNRILVHFYTNQSLYAYYPDDDKRWDVALTPCTWSAEQVFVEEHGILFDYIPQNPQVLSAFHLPTEQELNVIFTSEVPMEVWRYEYDNIISFGNEILSLVAFSSSGRDHPTPHTDVYFAKFRFQRPPDRPADLLITPLDRQTIALNSSCYVRKYLPF